MHWSMRSERFAHRVRHRNERPNEPGSLRNRSSNRSRAASATARGVPVARARAALAARRRAVVDGRRDRGGAAACDERDVFWRAGWCLHHAPEVMARSGRVGAGVGQFALGVGWHHALGERRSTVRSVAHRALSPLVGQRWVCLGPPKGALWRLR
jgi:hypothetical protein